MTTNYYPGEKDNNEHESDCSVWIHVGAVRIKDTKQGLEISEKLEIPTISLVPGELIKTMKESGNIWAKI